MSNLTDLYEVENAMLTVLTCSFSQCVMHANPSLAAWQPTVTVKMCWNHGNYRLSFNSFIF